VRPRTPHHSTGHGDVPSDAGRRVPGRLALAGEAYEGSGYVVVDELGRPFKTDKLRREAQKLMEAAGVRKVRLYDARHACLSWMANNGVPDRVSRPGPDTATCRSPSGSTRTLIRRVLRQGRRSWARC
jgi:integrase